MEITGVILRIGEIEERNTFKARRCVITTGGQFPETLEIQAVQDKVSMFDHYSAGDEIVASVNLRGKEWTNPSGEVKVFMSLQVWQMSKKQSQPNVAPEKYIPALSSGTIVDEPKDLPF